MSSGGYEVFLSYASEDRAAVAEPIYTRLRIAGSACGTTRTQC